MYPASYCYRRHDRRLVIVIVVVVVVVQRVFVEAPLDVFVALFYVPLPDFQVAPLIFPLHLLDPLHQAENLRLLLFETVYGLLF